MGSRLLEETNPTPSPVVERLEREIDRLHAQLATARAEGERVAVSLRELHAFVWGECPRLLDEDRGGDAELDIRVIEALEGFDRAQAKQGEPSDIRQRNHAEHNGRNHPPPRRA